MLDKETLIKDLLTVIKGEFALGGESEAHARQAYEMGEAYAKTKRFDNSRFYHNYQFQLNDGARVSSSSFFNQFMSRTQTSAYMDAEKAVKKPLRMMIVGVPNVGKSSLINRLTGKKSAQVGDRPGVTRGKQWLTLKNGMQLLDTPGILWPKFEDPKTGINLAYCGSIKDEIMDIATLAMELIGVLAKDYPDLLMERYKLDEILEMPLDNMEAIAMKRGFILPGKRIDYERCAKTVLDEFRSGKIGNITLERL